MLDPQSVIPMVIETTGRGERAYDIYSMLLKNRIILVSGPINEQISNLIIAQLIHLSHEDPDSPIQMYVSSPGGGVYAGLGIYDTMQMIPNQISTVAVGSTASFGTVLLTCGSKGHRFALPNATIHMHQPMGGAQGQATDIEIQANEIIRLKKRLLGILEYHTGQTYERLEKDTNRDFFMDADQAVEYGLVDKVLEIPDSKKPNSKKSGSEKPDKKK